MPSDRKLAANQSNAKKSTGPRSKAGRQASRRNALRHGLAIDIRTDPAHHDDIEQLAKMMSRACGMQNVSDSARDAAEAVLDLFRIRRVRAFLYETLYFADAAAPDRLIELNDKLAKLGRYERRAYSRRNRAMRSLYQAFPFSNADSADPVSFLSKSR
jgi:hypothetical protein